MDTIKYGFAPFAITTVAIISAECSASLLPNAPLLVTGGIRIIDILIILSVTWFFIDTAQIPGILPNRIKAGLFKGAIWSAGFGLIAVLVGAGCFMAGLNPFSLIYVSLPHRLLRLLLFFTVAGVVGPFAEELFFRGVIYGYCRRFGVWAATIISTALFVAAHRISGGIPVPQLVGGVIFAIAYEKEKNIMASASIHVLGNMTMFCISLLYFGH